ncbi:MAG TPA: hypothetical protein VII06_29405 [Chloroflexota bacterium]|jgi:hypothetical protein
MKEGDPGDLYKPRTPRQHQFFLQLETACDTDDLIGEWPLEEPQPVVATVCDGDGHTEHLAITPQFQRGVRKVIFSRLMDLAAEGHGAEAMDIVVGWRAKPPSRAR